MDPDYDDENDEEVRVNGATRPHDLDAWSCRQQLTCSLRSTHDMHSMECQNKQCISHAVQAMSSNNQIVWGGAGGRGRLQS